MKKLKKTLCLCLAALLLLLTACSHENIVEEEGTTEETVSDSLSLCGVWLSCYELKNMLASGVKEDYAANVQAALQKCVNDGINTVFFQVRPFADSVYPSENFPLSDYVLSSSGAAPDFDVLEIFIDLANSFGINVHAWINPYRISYKTDKADLDSNSIANDDKYSECIVCTDAGIYLDPSAVESRSLVLGGVREILENYDVDGIHIDDYFYPLTDDDFDKARYDDYCSEGGLLSLGEWRRANVNTLVSSLYSLVHSYGSDLIFSVSPAGDIDKNFEKYYADVELWLKSDGYADMIIPQLYYGFEHEKMPFKKAADEWASLERSENVTLACGLALYKQGTEDKLAGSGSKEWVDNSDVISRQIEYLRSSDYCGYVLFSYENI